MAKTMAKIAAFLATLVLWIENSRPLDNFVYPFLLDRFGHTVARRTCGVLLLLGCVSLLPVYFVLVFTWNTVLDFLHVGLGLTYAAREGWAGVTSPAEDDEA